MVASVTRPLLVGGIFAGICVVQATHAEAQAISRFAIHAEGGLGSMLADYQRTTLDQGLMIEGSLRLAVTLFEPLQFQVSFSRRYFPAGAEHGGEYTGTGGLRFEPRVGSLGRAFVDANVGYGQTASLGRVAFDAGVGFEFALGRAIGIGPYARYGVLFASGQDYPSDAQYVAVGLSISARVPRDERRPESPDTDHDGVFDPDDLCPTVPQGADPDPARRGCPREQAAAHPSESPAAVETASSAPPPPQPEPAREPERVSGPPQPELVTLYFAHGAATALRSSRRTLARDAASLRRSGESFHVVIEGYADDTGPEDFNQTLSEQRAIGVRNFFVSHGVASAQLRTIGYGEARPAATGTDEDTRARNRRVEFRIENSTNGAAE